MVQWAIILFLVFGPLLWRRMDQFLTHLYVSSVTEYWPYYVVILGLVILVWVFQLVVSSREARKPKFAMEAKVDHDEAQLVAEGKSIAGMEEFRRRYRRMHFIDILTKGVTAAVYIMYYQIWVFMIFVIRHKVVVMKDSCGALTFTSMEKIYVSQFLSDLPFKLSELLNINGSCRPNEDLMAIRVMNSMANLLHWALVIGVVGFIWGKQIKQWFTER